MNLNTPTKDIIGIGPGHAEKLHKLGISSIEDLLLYLPRRWDDYSKVVFAPFVKPTETVTIHGHIAKIVNKRIRNGRSITEAIIKDEKGSIKAVWFNQPFLVKNLKERDEIYLSGKVEWNKYGLFLNSPSYEKVTDADEDSLMHTARIVPIYPETEGVSSKWLRTKIKPMMKFIYSLKDYLPQEVKNDQNLIDFPTAIRQMHFPESQTLLRKAKERLDFDEMFLMQLAVLNSKKQLKNEAATSIPFSEELIKKFVQKLDFELTDAQRRSIWEIIQDLSKPHPMNRLLQGDVGSGKTVVAAAAMLDTAGSGSQAVLLCPTEILAKQHYQKISELLNPFGFEIGLLVGSTPKSEKKELLAKIKEGEMKILVGTHAVLEKNVVFYRLALAVVDEQHRFGVDQRNALKKESLETGTLPHFLSMTATPIPRTLTLTLYGDLDASVLDEMPKGRQKVISKLVPKDARHETYKFVENELKKGRQVFVVCPLIGEDGEETKADLEDERKTVLAEYENLKKVFTSFKIGLLHGRLTAAEKEKVMKDFLDKKTNILVSTSVIEVGIDVPNATIMIIEDADRFGLSQLHQFRGRVGRGRQQSYCFLFTKTMNDDTLGRLKALTETTDGFKLAGIDLELRGPGDFIGSRQHGLPDIKMRNLTNTILIKRCREAAERFLAGNDLENFPMLKEKTKKFEGVLHLE
jgi:ATP-dependent DNA helicase RecG